MAGNDQFAIVSYSLRPNVRAQNVALPVRPVLEGCHQLLCQRRVVQTRPDSGLGVHKEVWLRSRSAILEGVWTHNGRYGACLTVSGLFVLAGQITVGILAGSLPILHAADLQSVSVYGCTKQCILNSVKEQILYCLIAMTAFLHATSGQVGESGVCGVCLHLGSQC